MNKTLVSVIIPSYNRASVLPRAVQSVLAQTFHDFEIIIVDDGSNDKTADVIGTFQDPRIRYIRHEKNKGGNAARNIGIIAANGEYVAFLDSDDQWLPQKLKKQMALFVSPVIGLVYCGLQFIDNQDVDKGRKLVKCTNGFREDLIVSNIIGSTSVVVVRIELLRKIGGFDENLRSCQDWDMYLRLMELCEFGCVEEVLVRYQIDRKGKKQISTDPEAVWAGQNAIRTKFAKEIAALPKPKQIARVDYLLTIFMGMAHLKGITLAWEAFCLSGNIKYFFFMARIVVKYVLRKLRIL